MRCCSYILSVILGLILASSNLFAQLEVSLLNDRPTALDQIFELQIENRSGQPYVIVLDVEVRQENEVVYKAQTGQYAIVSPISQLSSSQLQPIIPQINMIENFEGKYDYTISVIDIGTNTYLKTERIRLKALGAGGSTVALAPSSLDFQYSGRARFYGQLSSAQGVGSAVPQNYGRAEIHPDFSLYGIPIGGDILLSTEQNADKQSMNQFALRFDVQQFKRQMQQRLYAKIKEIDAIGELADLQSLDDLKAKALEKKFPQLQEWEAQLQDPKIQQGLQDLKQLESLNQILESQEVKDALANKAKLEAMKQLDQAQSAELQRLQSFASEIKKLQSKAKQIESVASQYEKYKDVRQKIKQAKRYADKDIIKDPSFLKDGLKSLNVLSKPQAILNGFDAITLGTSYPYYSRYSLNGLSINGIHVEWNPGQVFLSTSYGRSSRRTLNTAFAYPLLTLPQNTLAVKAGYGSPHSTHLHVEYFDIKDRFEEAVLDNEISAQQNKIVGLTGQLDLLGGNILLGGEVMSSLLTRDHTIQTDDVQEFKRSDVPLNWLFGNVNNASSFDVAWKLDAEARVFGNNTRVKGSVERVGANYYSLGSPTLLNDMLRWRVDVQQALLDNQVRLTAFARQDDNFINEIYADGSNTTRMFGLSGTVNIRKWPMLYVSYSPYAQNADLLSQGQELDTRADIFNANLSYPYSFGTDLSAMTQLTYLYQDLESNIAGINHDLIQYGVTQSLTYQRSSLSAHVSYTPNQVIGDQTQEVLTANISAYTQLFQKLQLTGGYQYLSIKDAENRTGFYVDGRYPITSWADVELRVQRNVYNTFLDASQDFQDLVAWGGINFRW